MGRPWLRLLYVLLVAAPIWQLTIGQENLLLNPSFEEPLDKIWKATGSIIERWADDAYDGNYSLKLSQRFTDIDGAMQKNLPVYPASYYEFEAYVKLLNQTAGTLWEPVKIVMTMKMDGGNVTESYIVAVNSFCNVTKGWTLVKGSIRTPNDYFNDTRLNIRGPGKDVDFLLDKVSLIHVPENTSWRDVAEVNMDTHRKSVISLTVNLPTGANASHFDVQVLLTKHLYPFGSMLRVDELLEVPMNNITKLSLNWFNWATIQNYKWKYNKGKPENTTNDFSDAVDATDFLLAHGIKVRGHAVFWDMEKAIPEWVLQVPHAQLMSKLHEHLAYMINLARGKLQQWDIMNEHPPGLFYEEELQKPDVTKELFLHARELNDSAKLFLNNFQCVTSGGYTEMLRSLALEYISENIPIDGVACQGHTKPGIKPDPTAMWRRIDRLAETGLEVMMSEFDIQNEDQLERADWMEDAMRAFFAHPNMSGVILWDFNSCTMRLPNKELVDGCNDTVTILEPGQRWACLVKKEWLTNETFNMGAATSVSLKGFHGDYQVVVRRSGVPVQVENFTLAKGGSSWTLYVIDSDLKIEVPTQFDYVPECISHREERCMGAAATWVNDTSLSCRTAQSDYSGLGENDVVSVTCEDDEVMTDCTSFHKTKSWTRNGEKIEVNSTTNTVTCHAYNGRNSPDGVRAYARCCKLSSLTCEYRTAGPSYVFDGAMAEARCDAGTLALGCSSYSAYPDSDGVKNSEDLSSCIAQSGKPIFTNPIEKSGDVVFSTCCKALVHWNCTLMVSKPTILTSGDQKSVTCPEGFTMTGCSAYADGGKSAGARIWTTGGEDICKAFMGADLPEGSTGVRAYATCCQVISNL